MVRLGRRQMEQTPGEVFYGDFVACDAFDVMERLAEIVAPALVVCGTHDKMTPAKYAIYLRDQIARGRSAPDRRSRAHGHDRKAHAVIQALSGLLDRL